ncbi:MAG: flagellar filament outer layer protein FlaA [Treponema sp.]|jgi:hypothetical protein|nr:flagellar filament outer layer protein FlaA [Treponema sp.]
MKQGCFRVVCLILLLGAVLVPGFSDEFTITSEAFVIESFDGSAAHEWTIAGKTSSYEFTWSVMPSKFSNEGYPKLNTVPAWPQALFGANRQGNDYRVLGILGNFLREGYNWIDVYPVAPNADGEEAPFEIPLPGRVQNLDMWIWGSNYNFYVDAYVRDYQGIVHVLRMGDLSYKGWKNLRVAVPSRIRQAKRILPNYAGLDFVKFRIWTRPNEILGDFYIYLDHFKVLSDTFESFYDGDDLADPDHVQELWSAASN